MIRRIAPAVPLSLAVSCSLGNIGAVPCNSATQCQFAFGPASTCNADGYCVDGATDPAGDSGGTDPLDSTAPVDTDTSDTAVTEPTVYTFDLAVHYEFEDVGVTVSDSSGRGFHATISDLSARTADGRDGRGISLSAAVPATQFVELPSGLLADVDDFTVAVWVKLNTIQPWSRVYDIGNGLTDPANRFMYLTPSGLSGLHAASYGGSAANESTLTTGTVLPTGVWKHLALTGHGGDRTLYIDGFPAQHLLDAPDVPPLEMEPISPNSWLGRSRFVADPGLDGALDDFRVYGRVLSAAEIADLARPQLDYAHWRFDGSGLDASDHDITALLVDGATYTQAGRLGQALDLAGAAAGPFGPHATLDDNPLEGCDQAFTILLWLKLRGFDTDARVFDFGTADDTRSVYLAPSDGAGLHFGMETPTDRFDLTTDSPLFAADDTWHQVAVTIDASNLVVLYVDGVIAATRTSDIAASALAGLDENLLGRSRSLADPYLDGSIDELRIACRPFTPDEIRNFATAP